MEMNSKELRAWDDEIIYAVGLSCVRGRAAVDFAVYALLLEGECERGCVRCVSSSGS